MQSTEGMKLRLSKHAREQIEAKFGTLGVELAEAAFKQPDNLYPNKKYIGQFRVIGNGMCLIGKPNGVFFHVFTVYEDGVMTPPRPDQMNTPEGRQYAKLYEKMQSQKNSKANNGNMKRQNEYWPRVHERRSEIGHTLIK